MTIRRPDATRPRHVIALCKYAEERIECECGETITAEPDAVKRDAHLPLAKSWETHRRDAGLTSNAGLHGARRRVGKP